MNIRTSDANSNISSKILIIQTLYAHMHHKSMDINDFLKEIVDIFHNKFTKYPEYEAIILVKLFINKYQNNGESNSRI